MDLPRDPHRRYDPLRDAWVLVSPGRTDRPWVGAVERPDEAARPAYDPSCYLCPGNSRAGGAVNPRYDSTFVFTNDFAALRPDIAQVALREGPLRLEGAPGTCRVVCFSPRHDLSLGELAIDEVGQVIDLWAAQTSELGAHWRWVQVFENRGPQMGASNPHPHGQIWAGAALPNEAVREQESQRRHLNATGHRLLSEYLLAETGGPRVIVENESWLAVVPFWAIWPFETLLLPKEEAARLDELDSKRRRHLAEATLALLRAYDRLFDVPFPYSMGWHQAPFDGSSTDPWLLHAHYYPPLLRSAEIRKFMVGYELLSEPQRDLTPEEAAERLRARV